MNIRDKYYYYLGHLFETYFTEDYLFPKFDFYKELLKPFVEMDTYFDDSFGFSYTDFLNAYEYESNKQAKYGLKGFVTTRRATGIPMVPKIILGHPSENNFNLYPNPAFHTLNIKMLDFKEVLFSIIFGQQVLISNESNIDISMLSKGVCIYRQDRDLNGKILNRKLIKDNDFKLNLTC